MLSDHKSKLPTLSLACFILLYCATRLFLINKEFTYEEPLWIKQGLTFFSTGKFESFVGIQHGMMSGFHKPPLISVILGLVGLPGITANWIFRLVPFILGLAAGAILLNSVLKLRGSPLIFSLLFIFSPFLLAGNLQIQTDGTVGILGYAALVAATLCVLNQSLERTSIILLIGFWLAFGKSEIYVFGLAGLLATAVLSGHLRDFIRPIFLYCSAFVLSLILIAAMSLMTFGNLDGVSEVYGTITRIISSQLERKVSSPGMASAANPSLRMWSLLSQWHLVPLFVASAVLGCIKVYIARTPEQRSSLISLLAYFLIPALTYLFVAWTGDGFPRYYLIVAPVCMMLLAIGDYASIRIGIVSLVTALLVVAYSLPLYQHTLTTTKSQAGFYNEEGFEAAATILRDDPAITKPILAPDPVGYYFTKPYYDISLTQPYPQVWADLQATKLDEISAWVYFVEANSDLPEDAGQKEFYAKLQQEGRIERIAKVGTLAIAYLRPPQVAPTL